MIIGKIQRTHLCAAGFRTHVSIVKVKPVSSKMGVIVESDGGKADQQGVSKRQYWYAASTAQYEIGQKIRLSSLF